MCARSDKARRFSLALFSSRKTSEALLRSPTRLAIVRTSFFSAARERASSLKNSVIPAATIASALIDRITITSWLRSDLI